MDGEGKDVIVEIKSGRIFLFSSEDRAVLSKKKLKELVQKFSRECSTTTTTTTTTSTNVRFFRERLVPEDDVLGAGYSRETFLVPDGMPFSRRSVEN